MRKIKIQVQISFDGCIEGFNNEMDWLISDDDLIQYKDDVAESADAIMMGLNMVDEFIPYWAEDASKPNDSWNAFAKKLIEIPKVVFTKALTRSNWVNSLIAKGDPKDEITELKSQGGK